MSAAHRVSWPQADVGSVETDFRSIFEQAPVPAARCNQHGIILQTNPAYEHLLNLKKASGGALRVDELIGSDNGQIANRLLSKVLEGTLPAAHVEKGNSDYGWIIWRVAGNGRKPAEALLLAESGSDDASGPKDSLQAERWETMGRLTGGVAHDFNNLLTGVMLYSDLLLANLGPGERQLRRYTEEIRGAVAQATVLVRQLLVFARSKSGAARPISLNQVAETMQDLLACLIGEHIQLELHLDRSLGVAEMDPAQAEQLLLNLVLNARDAMPNGGRIVIETSNCKIEQVQDAHPIFSGTPAFPCVQLAVSDNGCGMDEATCRRLFEPFYTTKPTGTGLGLATVQSIVTSSRGLIHVDSEPGRGTRVMILLPQSSSPVASPHLAAPNSEPTKISFPEVKKEPHL